MEGDPRHENCWAKTTEDGLPRISVRHHCLNVGCVAEALRDLLPAPLRGMLPVGTVTLAALHDVGKVSPGFQQKAPAWLHLNRLWFKASGDYESSHQKTSQVFLERSTKGRLRNWAEAV